MQVDGHVRSAVPGGNECHCPHVTQLIQDVEQLKTLKDTYKDDLAHLKSKFDGYFNQVGDIAKDCDTHVEIMKSHDAMIKRLDEAVQGITDFWKPHKPGNAGAEIPRTHESDPTSGRPSGPGAPGGNGGSSDGQRTYWNTAQAGASQTTNGPGYFGSIKGPWAGTAWTSNQPATGPSPDLRGDPRGGGAPDWQWSNGTNVNNGINERTKLFEEKTAENHTGDGSPDTGPSWFRWTRMYLIGNADCEEMLKWAESRTNPITKDEVARMINPTLDPTVLSGHLWKYLNQALVKNGRVVFENLETRNGFEAWRRIHRMIFKSSMLQKHTLGLKITQPEKYLKESNNLSAGIEKWEQDIRNYIDAGGQAPNDDLMVVQLCAALPSTLRSNLILRTDEFRDYAQFKHYVTEQTEKLEHFGGRGALNILEEEDDELMVALQEQFADNQEVMETLNAFTKGNGRFNNGRFKPKDQKGNVGGRVRSVGQGPPGARPREGAREERRPDRCINCGGNHRSSDCTKGRTEKKDRPCWNCGKPGHLSSQCPEKKSLKTFEEEAVNISLSCLVNSEGYELRKAPHVENGKWHKVEGKFKPKAAENTVGDYIAQAFSNKYEALRVEENIEKIKNEPQKQKEHASCIDIDFHSVSVNSQAGAPNGRMKKRERMQKAKQFVPLCNFGVHGAMEVRADELPSETPGKSKFKCVNIGCGCFNFEDEVKTTDHQELGSNYQDTEAINKEYMNNMEVMDTNFTEANYKDIMEDEDEHEEDMDFMTMKDITGADGINILEAENDPLMNTDEDGYVTLELTGDTGAVDHVMSPDEVPGHQVQESAGSKAGRGFIGPAGERIDNLGQLALDMQAQETGQKLTATFQAAEVTRALMSISKICDSGEGTKVVFDSKQGLVTRKGRELAKFHRKGGLYVMKVRVRTPGKPKEQPRSPEQGFTRPGATR